MKIIDDPFFATIFDKIVLDLQFSHHDIGVPVVIVFCAKLADCLEVRFIVDFAFVIPILAHGL